MRSCRTHALTADTPLAPRARQVVVLNQADVQRTIGYIDRMWMELEFFAYLPNAALLHVRQSLGGRQQNKQLKLPIKYVAPSVQRRDELRRDPKPSGGPILWWMAANERGETMWMIQPECAALLPSACASRAARAASCAAHAC